MAPDKGETRLARINQFLEVTRGFWAHTVAVSDWSAALQDTYHYLNQLHQLIRRHSQGYAALPEVQGRVELVGRELELLTQALNQLADGRPDPPVLDVIAQHADRLAEAVAGLQTAETQIPMLSTLPILNQVLLFGQHGIATVDAATGVALLERAGNYSRQIRTWTTLVTRAKPPGPAQAALLQRLEMLLVAYDTALDYARTALEQRDEGVWKQGVEQACAAVEAVGALREEFASAQVADQQEV